MKRPFAAIRIAKGISRQAAADALGISAGHLRRLESGKAPLSLLLAERMSAFYEVTLNDLTRGSAELA